MQRAPAELPEPAPVLRRGQEQVQALAGREQELAQQVQERGWALLARGTLLPEASRVSERAAPRAAWPSRLRRRTLPGGDRGPTCSTCPKDNGASADVRPLSRRQRRPKAAAPLEALEQLGFRSASSGAKCRLR